MMIFLRNWEPWINMHRVFAFCTNPGELKSSDQELYGASAHSDFGMLALLVTNGVPRLQRVLTYSSAPTMHPNVENPTLCSPTYDFCNNEGPSDGFRLTPVSFHHVVCRDKSKQPRVWEDVPHIDGAFIVNIGDLLERCTNGLFRSTLHRVVASEQERYSVAFFLDPNDDFIVECLASCCSESSPPIFPPIRSGDCVIERLKITYGSQD